MCNENYRNLSNCWVDHHHIHCQNLCTMLCFALLLPSKFSLSLTLSLSLTHYHQSCYNHIYCVCMRFVSVNSSNIYCCVYCLSVFFVMTVPTILNRIKFDGLRYLNIKPNRNISYRQHTHSWWINILYNNIEHIQFLLLLFT